MVSSLVSIALYDSETNTFIQQDSGLKRECSPFCEMGEGTTEGEYCSHRDDLSKIGL